MKPTLSTIVCMASNRVIGKDNKLLWHISEDLKHFKEKTKGNILIMGRKSYESILDQLGKPLPGRTSIVLTTQKDYSVQEGVHCVNTVEEALDLAHKLAIEKGQNEIFNAGGAEIYKLLMPYTNRLYLTILEKSYTGDALFPEWDEDCWDCVNIKSSEDKGLRFHFKTYERKV